MTGKEDARLFLRAHTSLKDGSGSYHFLDRLSKSSGAVEKWIIVPRRNTAQPVTRDSVAKQIVVLKCLVGLKIDIATTLFYSRTSSQKLIAHGSALNLGLSLHGDTALRFFLKIGFRRCSRLGGAVLSNPTDYADILSS